MTRDTIRPIWCTVAGVVTAAMLAIGLGPSSLVPSASAATPSCFTYSNGDDYGSMSASEFRNGHHQKNLSGIRAKVPIKSSFHCQKIYSVYVGPNDLSMLYEFGYALGHISCFGGSTPWEYHRQPTLFAVAIDIDGYGYCKIWGSSNHPTGGTTNVFRASDVNENGYWGGYWKGTAMQPNGWNLGFTQSIGGLNMERARPNESAAITFSDVDEVINGTWSDTDDLRGTYDQDPDYKWQIPNSTTAKIVSE